MIEELKLAVKVDSSTIERLLLEQFNNAEKLANKVVFTFKNINLDNKSIESQFKEMQKLAGKNPIELPIDTDKSLTMLRALGNEFTRILSIAKGDIKLFDINGAERQIAELRGVINELQYQMSKMYTDNDLTDAWSSGFSAGRQEVRAFNEELDRCGEILKVLSSSVNNYESALKNTLGNTPALGKDISLVNNKEFQLLVKEVENVKNEINELKSAFKNLENVGNSGVFGDKINNELKGMSSIVTTLTSDVLELQKALDKSNSKTNQSSPKGSNQGVNQAENERKALEKATNEAKRLAEEKRKSRQADKQTTQSSVNKALKDQLSAWKNIQNIRKEIAKTDPNDKNKINSLNKQKKAYQEQFLQAQRILKANKGLYNQEKQTADIEQERLKTNEQINKLKVGNVDSVINKATSDLGGFKNRINQSEEYQKKVLALSNALERLKTIEKSRAKSKLLSQGQADEINRTIGQIRELSSAIKNMPAATKGSDEISRYKELDKIAEYMKKNTRMSKEFKAELQGLMNILRTGGANVDVSKIHAAFEKTKDKIRAARQEGLSFFSIFKNKVIYNFATRMAQYYLSFYDWIRYTRYAITALVELDNALLDLKKTTTMTKTQLEDFYYASNDVAKEMGVTTKAIIEQASAWSRLGLTK